MAAASRPKMWGEEGYTYSSGERLPADPADPYPGPSGTGSTDATVPTSPDDQYTDDGQFRLRYNVLVGQVAAWMVYADDLEVRLAACQETCAADDEQLALLAADKAAAEQAVAALQGQLAALKEQVQALLDQIAVMQSGG